MYQERLKSRPVASRRSYFLPTLCEGVLPPPHNFLTMDCFFFGVPAAGTGLEMEWAIGVFCRLECLPAFKPSLFLDAVASFVEEFVRAFSGAAGRLMVVAWLTLALLTTASWG